MDLTVKELIEIQTILTSRMAAVSYFPEHIKDADYYRNEVQIISSVLHKIHIKLSLKEGK